VVAAAAWVGSLRGQVNHNAYAAAQFSAKIKARRMVRASTFPAPLATLSP
jgi:nitrogen fixation protein FixH